jgi:uncharacterized protein (TIGR02594 family)
VSLSVETPWMDWMHKHLGWNEANNDKQLAEFWKYTTYTAGQKAHTVRGRAFAWCAMTVNAALFESGYVGNRNPAAISFASYGTHCEPKYGAIIVIEHPSGSHHVTFFNKWVDESKKICECLGGNQSDSIKISLYNLSGQGHDKMVACRWPHK